MLSLGQPARASRTSVLGLHRIPASPASQPFEGDLHVANKPTRSRFAYQIAAFLKKRPSHYVIAIEARGIDVRGDNLEKVMGTLDMHRSASGESGRARLEQALNVARAADDGWSRAVTLVALSDLERSQDEHARAGALYEESLPAFAAIGLAEHPRDPPYLLHNRGYVALAGGHLDRAANLFAGALEGNLHAADRRGVAECLICIGATAAAMGDAPCAVQLFALVKPASPPPIWSSGPPIDEIANDGAESPRRSLAETPSNEPGRPEHICRATTLPR